ncbi:helix-turn-helix transcriptional regulator [Rhodovulum sulfidophilum]|uniref:helix-turn-helix domain-containing protein n=1 Tax=Rhodovulum sulfidophilum TaxID=35806 RepID=UPI0019240BAA|nr:helix-turn-helix transcriptional regulator [Rhodovulum sulfidophilum]MBL3566441.1 helix-turn-helix transcriptional regulator [Rhodovulum sulfidophilum]
MPRITPEWIRSQLNQRPRGAQAELARFVGIEPDQLSKSLNGHRQFKPREIERVAEFFGERPYLDSSQAQLIDLWQQLTEAERQFLLNAARAQIASRQAAD